MEQDWNEILREFPDIEFATVLGSTVGGKAGSSSDLDVAVVASRQLTSSHRMALIETLANRFGRPVDLVDLSTVGEPLLGTILRTGRPVLRRDKRRYLEAVKRHIFDMADFEPYRRRILKERRRAWIGQ